VLRARFKERPAGHWVVFRTTYQDVNVIAMAYAWSMRGTSYVISTCGSTDPCDEMCTTYFEDEHGHVSYKEISRPKLANMIYEYLPLIDEHNKQRQDLLRS
jgi:hypothetical protein